MGISTFGSFTQARLAIYAAQTGINVTGNNISNINTPGYTRQRLNQVSLYTAGADRYYSEGDIRTGQGALVKSISQIRSPYLDIRFRTENAKVGYMDAKLDTLKSIAQVLDEVGKGDAGKDEDGFGILGLDIGKLATALGDLTSETGHREFDNTVKAVASSIITKLHSYAGQLESLQGQTVHKFKQNVAEVNRLLTSIRSYNEEIRLSEIHGDPALELRDKRNVDIDELSRLIDINVVYGEEEVSAGFRVEKLTITLDDANPDKTVKTDEALLIDGVFGAQIELDQIPQTRELDPDDTTTWPYMKDDGAGNLVPAMTAEEAAKRKNPKWDGTDPAAEYLDEKGNPTDEAHAALEANPKYQPYLDEKGQPTGNVDEAKLVDHPNYNMTITELKNKKGDLYIGGKSYAAHSILGGADALDNDGNVTWVGNLFKGVRGDSVSVKQKDVPSEGDTTVTIYRRTPQLDKDGNQVYEDADKKIPRYTYTKQVYEQILTRPVSLDDNDLNGELQADREMLTEKGDFVDLSTIDNIDERSAGKRGIQYYQRCLDLLANQLATFMNEANQGFRVDKNGSYITESINNEGKTVGVPITITGINADGTTAIDAATKEPMTFTLQKGQTWSDLNPFLLNAIKKEVGLPLDQTIDNEIGSQVIDAYLKGQQYDDAAGAFVDKGPARGIFDGAVLFSNDGDTNDTTNITASNISISRAWRDNPVLVRSFECPDNATEPASGQSDNLLHMQYLVGTHKWQFHPNTLESTKEAGGGVMFEGTIHEFWNSAIGSMLGADQEETEDMLNMYYENALSIDTDRDSVSSVDFNDEAMNLMMYSKSYNAACRLMTTIDSVLDKLINNTGMTT